MSKKKENFRKTFRKNKKNEHPAYLIDRDGNVYQYIGITHSEKTNDRDNLPLKKNPDPRDERPAFIRPEVESDDKKNFGRAYHDWAFSPKDKPTVQSVIDKKKKPRK